MTRDVKFVGSDARLMEAARIMKEMNIGTIPVSEGNDLKGIITDRDIVVRGVASGLDPTGAHVGEAMSEKVVSCAEEADVSDAARLMETE